MSAAVAFEPATVEIPRDRWDRPLVVPPNGGKPEPYTRCTTFVGCLEDTYNLSRWQQRKVAEGLAQREDLLLLANSLGPEPDKYADEAGHRRWKKTMDSVCEDAAAAAKARASATIGSALHALTERMDRGLDLGHVPPDYRPHLRAYELATTRLTALHIEEFTVNDELRIGGTPDRVVTVDGLPGAYIADTKTGSVEYGVLKMAMQLAVYSRSQLYDPTTGQRSPYGVPVDQERGLIVALNAGTGLVDLLWVDLAAGWQAVQLAGGVRGWRQRRDLSRPATELTGELSITEPLLPMTPGPALLPEPMPLSPATDAALLVAIDHAATPDELVDLWTAAKAAWTAEHTARAAARKTQLITEGR